MAGGLFDKLFGRPADPPAAVADAVAELRRLAAARPSLTAPAGLLAAILPRLFAEPASDPLPTLPPETASAKLAGGVPLLRGESVQLDETGFRRRWQAVCAAVREHQNDDMGKALADALAAGRLVPQELLQAVLAGRPEGVHAQADALGLDAGLTASVLGLTLFPSLARMSQALAPLRHGASWQQGYCPTCGSWPLLGEFRGLEQTRVLRCGLCAAEWEFPRLLCPFCGNRDHETLGYFAVQGEESRHRATRCDVCQRYVKMVSTLGPLTAPGLLAADVATLYLDLAAADHGRR